MQLPFEIQLLSFAKQESANEFNAAEYLQANYSFSMSPIHKIPSQESRSVGFIPPSAATTIRDCHDIGFSLLFVIAIISYFSFLVHSLFPF